MNFDQPKAFQLSVTHNGANANSFPSYHVTERLVCEAPGTIIAQFDKREDAYSEAIRLSEIDRQ